MRSELIGRGFSGAQTPGMERPVAGAETVGREQARVDRDAAARRRGRHRVTGRAKQGCHASGPKLRRHPEDFARKMSEVVSAVAVATAAAVKFTFCRCPVKHFV